MPDEIDFPANRAVRALLEQNVKELSCESMGLEKVLAFLRDNTRTNIFVNWDALVAVGIDRNTPVTVSLREVPLRTVLNKIISRVGTVRNIGSGSWCSIGYTVEDGMIVISDRDDLNSEKYRITHTFNIRDLLTQARSPKERDLIVRNIVDTIKTTFAAETWRDVGGQVGTIREINGTLIINQTRDHQLAIEKLLDQLRGTHARVVPPGPEVGTAEQEKQTPWIRRTILTMIIIVPLVIIYFIPALLRQQPWVFWNQNLPAAIFGGLVVEIVTLVFIARLSAGKSRKALK